jgi:hypothetical protein
MVRRKIQRTLRRVQEREEGVKAREGKEETMEAGVEVAVAVAVVTGGREQGQGLGESSETEREAVNSVTERGAGSRGTEREEAATGKGDVEVRVVGEGEDQQLRSKRGRRRFFIYS